MARKRGAQPASPAAATTPAPRPDREGIGVAVRSHPDGAVLNLIVTPRSGVTEFAGIEGGAVRVRVAAPPVEGAANAALTRFLAEQLGVPRSSVRMLAGETGRRKRVLIEGVMPDVASAALRRGGAG